MVIKDQTILTLYENNFPLTNLSKQALLDKINSPEVATDGIFIYPGGLPTAGIDIGEVAGAAHNVRLNIVSAKQWQLIGDVEFFATRNGHILSQLGLENLQFWVRGYVRHADPAGLLGGLTDFLHLSYTTRVNSSVAQLSFKLKK